MTTMANVPAYLLPGVLVSHPAHLEGDPALATEILPGPPSIASVQQPVQKKDPKKPNSIISYLPASDPGSTYSGLMAAALTGQEADGPRRKRARTDKGSSGRAQRATARSLNGAQPLPETVLLGDSREPIILDTNIEPILVDNSDSPMTQPKSATLPRETATTNGTQRSSRKEKGKGKEIEGGTVRVKEEPKIISLNSPEPPANLVNEDHCSACRSQGTLVYCDGCPRAFHFWCLDPPMEAIDVPEGNSRWFCPCCILRKEPPPKPSPSFFSPVIHHVLNSPPSEFQLPEDIRTFFKDVATGPKGTYLDSSELKQPRLNRHGQLEDRDPHRLKDRNGAPVLCFRCGKSAIPNGAASVSVSAPKRTRSSSRTSTPDTWKNIVSCDYCTLHWHLDCLDPPIPTMPSFNKKWMCPNHADQVLLPKKRIPKQNAPPIEVTKPYQPNNGNIEIIHPQIASTSQNKLIVEEVLINGRRYRVPERIITLNFWEKVQPSGDRRESNSSSGLSSPLTSLSSLEDSSDVLSSTPDTLTYDAEDIRLAQMLCSLQTSSSVNRVQAKRTVDAEVQTEPLESAISVPIAEQVLLPFPPAKKESSSRAKAKTAVVQTKATPANSPLSAPKPRRRTTSSSTIQIESTRELRSRVKRAEASTPSESISTESPVVTTPLSTVNGSASTLSRTSSRSRPIKAEVIETIVLTPMSNSEIQLLDPPPSKKSTNSQTPQNRTTKKANPKVASKDKGVTKDKASVEEPAKKEKSKKRKEREDDTMLSTGVDVQMDYRAEKREKVKDKEDKEVKETGKAELKSKGGEEDKEKEKEKEKKERKKVTKTPSKSVRSGPSSTAPVQPTQPTTPSLKIRLPRLSDLGLQLSPSTPAVQSSNADGAKLS